MSKWNSLTWKEKLQSLLEESDEASIAHLVEVLLQKNKQVDTDWKKFGRRQLKKEVRRIVNGELTSPQDVEELFAKAYQLY
jgi:RNA polymerase-interacting CarD/CdnL/TRCF family regulator